MYFRVAIFLFFIGMFQSCAFYQRYNMPSSRLPKVNPQGLSVYLIDTAHPLTQGWTLIEPKFEKDKISGFVSRMAEVEVLEASMLRNNIDAQNSRNDVLIYIKPQLAMQLADTATMSIPAREIEKIQVCEVNHVKTFGAPLIGCTGMLLLIFLITGG